MGRGKNFNKFKKGLFGTRNKPETEEKVAKQESSGSSVQSLEENYLADSADVSNRIIVEPESKEKETDTKSDQLRQIVPVLSIEEELEHMKFVKEEKEKNPRTAHDIDFLTRETDSSKISEKMEKARKIISAHEEQAFHNLISAPPEKHLLGFEEKMTIAEYNSSPVGDVYFYDQPELGKTYQVNLEALKTEVSHWVEYGLPGDANSILLEQIEQIEREGNKEIPFTLVAFGIQSASQNATISRRESKEMFPILLDQDNNPIIDDGICMTLDHPTLGEIPTIYASLLGLDNIKDRVMNIEKVYSGDPADFNPKKYIAKLPEVKNIRIKDDDSE